MTDMQKHQADLLASQRHVNRAPLCCHEGMEIVDEVKPSRIGWWIWPALLVGLGVAAGIWGYARAANAAEPVRWVIWDVSADKPYHVHQFTSATACNTDIAGVKDGSGKRLACVRISTKGD